MTEESQLPNREGRAEALAQEIALAFGEISQLDCYRHVCRAHDPDVVYRAYREAMDVPLSKIRKTRRALFIYLIRKYE